MRQRDTYAQVARDALLRLATTHLYRDDPTAAARAELAPQGFWNRHAAALAEGVALARAALAAHGSARAALIALRVEP
jgi:hypothetical protein